MKKHYVSWLLAILLISVAFYSCKKDLSKDSDDNSTSHKSETTIQTFERQFNERGYQNSLITPINDTLNLKLIPDWQIFKKVKVNDTLEYYGFELNASTVNLRSGKLGRSPELLNVRKYLWVGKGTSSTFFRVATYFFEQDNSKMGFSTVPVHKNIFKDFTGTVVFKNLDLKTYNEAKYVKGININNGKDNKVILNGTKQTFAQQYECQVKYDCTYFATCDGWYLALEVLNVNSCPANYPFSQTNVCPSGTTQGLFPIYLSSQSQSLLCQWVDYPDPGTPGNPPVVIPPPIPCTNCSGYGYKCINGVCELGTKEYTTSEQDQSSGDWICYFHFKYSDNSIMDRDVYGNLFSETSMSPCYWH